MKNVNLVISSGSLTAAKNFTAYSLTKGRVHIHGKQLAAQKIDPATIQFPFYVTARVDDVVQGSWDAARTKFTPTVVDGKQVTEPRLTAVGVFLNKADLIKVHVEEATLDLDINQELLTKAIASGLTADAAAKLVATIDF